MYTLIGTCFEENYKKIINGIITQGRQRVVRGYNTIELSPCLYSTCYPLRNKLTCKERGVNLAFMMAEFLWIVSGKAELEMVGAYNSQLAKFSDDGVYLSGAYGPRFKDQLDYIIEALSRDHNSRQAVMTFWVKNPLPSKDIPCTVSLQFLHNHGELELLVNMRSNDAWLGLPYDFYSFTMLQNYVAMRLGSGVGRYTHVAGSLHLYEEHFAKAQLLANQVTYIGQISESAPFTTDQLDHVLHLEEDARLNGCVDQSYMKILAEPWREIAETVTAYQLKKRATTNEK